MARATVQGIILKRLDTIEQKVDSIVPALEGLKVKASVFGAIAGFLATGVVSMVIAAFK